MKNSMILLGAGLIAAYFLIPSKQNLTPIALTDSQGATIDPTVTHEDVVNTMAINPGWVPKPLSAEWHALFPDGVPNLGLGDSNFLNFQT